MMQTLSTAWNSVSVWTRGCLTLLLGSFLLLGLRTRSSASLLGSFLLFGLRTRSSASLLHKGYCWGWCGRVCAHGCGMILTHKCRTQLEEDL
jgi:uncharacterized membrane protein YphA (DoxX/SURF4 family)